jgi:hypothetical protein
VRVCSELGELKSATVWCACPPSRRPCGVHLSTETLYVRPLAPLQGCWGVFCGTGQGTLPVPVSATKACIGLHRHSFLRIVPASSPPAAVKTGSTTASHHPCTSCRPHPFTLACSIGVRARLILTPSPLPPTPAPQARIIGNTFAASLRTDICPQRKEARPRLTLGHLFNLYF